jgi:hypothetical protein
MTTETSDIQRPTQFWAFAAYGGALGSIGGQTTHIAPSSGTILNERGIADENTLYSFARTIQTALVRWFCRGD